MIYTLGHLYEQGKISSGIGAQVLGCDRTEFYWLLSEYGFSVIDYPPDELEEEAETSREIAKHVKDVSPPYQGGTRGIRTSPLSRGNEGDPNLPLIKGERGGSHYAGKISIR